MAIDSKKYILLLLLICVLSYLAVGTGTDLITEQPPVKAEASLSVSDNSLGEGSADRLSELKLAKSDLVLSSTPTTPDLPARLDNVNLDDPNVFMRNSELDNNAKDILYEQNFLKYKKYLDIVIDGGYSSKVRLDAAKFIHVFSADHKLYEESISRLTIAAGYNDGEVADYANVAVKDLQRLANLEIDSKSIADTPQAYDAVNYAAVKSTETLLTNNEGYTDHGQLAVKSQDNEEDMLKNKEHLSSLVEASIAGENLQIRKNALREVSNIRQSEYEDIVKVFNSFIQEQNPQERMDAVNLLWVYAGDNENHRNDVVSILESITRDSDVAVADSAKNAINDLNKLLSSAEDKSDSNNYVSVNENGQ